MQYLEKLGLLNKYICKKTKYEALGQRGGFLSMLVSALGASLFNDILLGKKIKEVIRAGEGTAKVGYGSRRSSIKRSSLKMFDPTASTNEL